MTADEEDNYHVAQANEALDAEGHFVEKINVSGRYLDETPNIRRQFSSTWTYPLRWYSLWRLH